MASSVLVTATQRRSGKSMITLGLLSVLEQSLGRVGYFKPIGQRGAEGVDPDVKLMKEVFGLEASYEEMTPVYMDEVTDALAHGKYHVVLDRILDAYQALQEKKDFVVCEGTDYFGAMAAFEFNINADLSKNLSAPIVLVANASAVQPLANGNGENLSPCESKAAAVLNNIGLVKESIDEKSADLFGVVINSVDPDEMACIEARALHDLNEHGIRLLGLVPRTDLLERPYLDEIARGIGAEVISGHGRLDVVARDVIVAAMSLESVLKHLRRGSLVVVPGDREDVLLGMACAYHSPAVPSPAGLVMTGGMEPREHVKKLFMEVTGNRMPVMRVDVDTYQATIKVNGVRPQLRAADRARIETVKSLVENSVEVDTMLARGAAPHRSRRVTPQVFLHKLTELARRDRRTIVLPEGEEERILKAAEGLLERKICDLVLLGDPEVIRRNANQMGLRLDEATIINPAESDMREPFARRYQELRAKKNPTFELALDLMHDPTYFGTMMVKQGQAHGMVSGSVNTTAHTLRPALEFIKTKEGTSIASSVFFMCLPNQVLVYGDCAVNPNPTAEQLADIAIQSAETALAFEVEPYVAMISYSTGESGKGSDVEKVRAATEIVKKRAPALNVEGPIQYDAAIDKSVAKTKLPNSRVAGAATVFIFPDLNTGNTTYKAVQRSANAIAVGPVMQGLKKPVNDLSRGCTIADIINTVAITAIQAQRD